MILYLDTSAVVKLYVDEASSDQVRAAVAEARGCSSHWIAYAETRAALARKTAEPRYSGQLAEWRTEFERDWRNFRTVSVTPMLVRRAGDLAERFGLRGYDSVHLAAAEAVWRELPGVEFRVVVFDEKLTAAARAMGIPVIS